MKKIYYTNTQAFYLVKRGLGHFPLGHTGQNGSICVGLDVDSGEALLLWEAGADWQLFTEDYLTPDLVEDWMPGALEEAIAELEAFSDEFGDDLEYYEDFASEAAEILTTLNQEIQE